MRMPEFLVSDTIATDEEFRVAAELEDYLLNCQ
jgi:hypothetical protein